MKIAEIFLGIQGEGKNTGLPTIFVRMQGCNLWADGKPCNFCDTTYGQNPAEGEPLFLAQVLEKVKAYRGVTRVCITGGEPLWQMSSFRDLVYSLKAQSYYVEVETNGSILVPLDVPVDCWTVDVKCPGSGTAESFACGNLLSLREQDQVKFVVSDEKDLEFMESFVSRTSWLRSELLVSPCWGRIDPLVIVDFITKRTPRVRLSLQIHKVLYGPDRRGV
jgi:7-carboxy-7-deazaguanine synthase